MSIQLELNFQKRGKALSAAAHNPYLRRAQELALELGEKIKNLQAKGLLPNAGVSVDDIRDLAQSRGIDIPSGNFWGSVFDRKIWEVCGWELARHERSHARRVLTWKLKTKEL